MYFFRFRPPRPWCAPRLSWCQFPRHHLYQFSCKFPRNFRLPKLLWNSQCITENSAWKWSRSMWEWGALQLSDSNIESRVDLTKMDEVHLILEQEKWDWLKVSAHEHLFWIAGFCAAPIYWKIFMVVNIFANFFFFLLSLPGDGWCLCLGWAWSRSGLEIEVKR